MPSFISASYAPLLIYAGPQPGQSINQGPTFYAFLSGFGPNPNVSNGDAAIQVTYSNGNNIDYNQIGYGSNNYLEVKVDFYSGSRDPAYFSAPYVYTFTDTSSNNYGSVSATLTCPVIQIIGNSLYQTYNTDERLGGIGGDIFQFVIIGNTTTVNILGATPGEVVSFTGGYNTQVPLGNATADANGMVNFVVSTSTESASTYSLSLTANTFSYNFGGIIFNQTTIAVANTTEISGYAFTWYDGSPGGGTPGTYNLSSVTLYANGIVIGNTVTDSTGLWTYSQPTLSAGTYTITAVALSQKEPTDGAFTWIYSNATITAVIGNITTNTDYVTQSALSVLWQPTPTIQFNRVSQASLSVLELLSNGETNHDRVSQVDLGVLIQEQSPDIYPNHVKTTQESLSVLLGPNTHHTRATQSDLSVLIQKVKPNEYFHTRTSQASLSVLVSHSAKRGKRSTIIIT